MENYWNFTPVTYNPESTDSLMQLADKAKTLQEHMSPNSSVLKGFKKITPEDMPEIWKYLKLENGRTTDFSYGGVLMWVDYFNYEFLIHNDTLFIKGVVENDLSKPAFSLPVGAMTIHESVSLLKEYCNAHGINLEFSAIPEYAAEEMKSLNPIIIEELTDWGDYLYDSESLASLKGKKMSKKRNHVNQFKSQHPDWKAIFLSPENADEAMAFMDLFDKEGDTSEMATAERALSRDLITRIKEGDPILKGMILYAGGSVAAYTIGDVKGDTLFIHVEKATRKINGSYEMINCLFAKAMTEKYPEIKFINREDDAGDIGLRMAKESYHPLEVLKKFNIIF